MSGVIASEPAGLAVGRLLVTFDDTGGQIDHKVAALGRVNIAAGSFCWWYAFDLGTGLGLSKLLRILVTLDYIVSWDEVWVVAGNIAPIDFFVSGFEIRARNVDADGHIVDLFDVSASDVILFAVELGGESESRSVVVLESVGGGVAVDIIVVGLGMFLSSGCVGSQQSFRVRQPI